MCIFSSNIECNTSLLQRRKKQDNKGYGCGDVDGWVMERGRLGRGTRGEGEFK